MWRVQAPQKMKALLWLINHGALMTNERRTRRGLSTNPNCMVCTNVPENLNHIFRSCSEARGVWNYFEQAGEGTHDPRLTMAEWIHRNVTMTRHNSQWPTKFVTTVWWLWRWRNDRCFGRTLNIPSDKFRFLFQRLQENIKAISLESKWLSTAKSTRREVMVGWEPPQLIGWR